MANSDFDFPKGFGSDNHSGVHPQILSAIQKVNEGHAPSYGTDDCSMKAIEKFKTFFGEGARIYFVFNGTAANTLSLQAALRSYESCLCSDVSHLHNDECGAPEFHFGGKLTIAPSIEGKLQSKFLEPLMIRMGDQHFSQIKMVSITQPTELGTLYTLDELKAMRDFKSRHNLYLHLDGARLLHACAPLNCSFGEIAEACGADAISFGGTKNGLLGAEAVILLNPELDRGFKFIRKQSLQLPSKSRFLAAQFLGFFENDLWKQISGHCLETAKFFASQVEGLNHVSLVYPVESNALFIKFPKAWTKELRKHSFFYIWDEQKWIARLMISFDTSKEEIKDFVGLMRKLDSQGDD